MTGRWAIAVGWAGIAIGLIGFAGGVQASTTAWGELMDAGQVAAEDGDLSAAKIKFEAALAMAKKESPGSSAEAWSLNGLGISLRSLGRFQEAIRALEDSHTIIVREFGENHPNAVSPLNNLASAYRETGNYDRALEILTQTLEIERKVDGESSVTAGEVHFRLGNVYLQAGRFEDSESQLKTAIAIFESKNSPGRLRAVLTALGSLYREIGDLVRSERTLKLTQQDYGVALEILNGCLPALAEFLPADHHRFGVLHMNIGAAQAGLANYEEAGATLAAVCAILDRALPEAHPERQLCLSNHCQILSALAAASATP